MLRDVVPFRDVWQKIHAGGGSGIASFVRFIEGRLGAEFVYDVSRIPLGQAELADISELAEKLKSAGVIQSYFPLAMLADEPRVTQWHAIFRAGDESRAKGSAFSGDDHTALTIALAEAVERHIWFERIDHFKSPRHATIEEMNGQHSFLPERFAGFSPEQRKTNQHLALTDGSYTWVQGLTWPEGKKIYIPEQIVSGSLEGRIARSTGTEPIIRRPTTCGLATWPTREGAILRGALELIERDAYMIMWLNQLTPPRCNIDSLARARPSLLKLIEECKRYRLKPHIVRMPTDAPTYALMIILEDETENLPRLSFGLKAGANPARAAEGALIEALRARYSYRASSSSKKEIPHANAVGHYDRILYWTSDERYTRLQFLLSGAEQDFHEPWEDDSDSEHLERIASWTQKKGYGFASVSFTHSSANQTPWHIEFVVIPELHPIHFYEKQPHLGGARLSQVPTLTGYKAREKPYLDDPHPFA